MTLHTSPLFLLGGYRRPEGGRDPNDAVTMELPLDDDVRVMTEQQEEEANWLRYKARLIMAQAENHGLLLSIVVDEHEQMEPVVTVAKGHGRVLPSGAPLVGRDVRPMPLGDPLVLTASNIFEQAPEEAWQLLFWLAESIYEKRRA